MLSTLRTLTEPRALLIGMMGLGAAFLAYVTLAAMVPTTKPWEETAAPLLTGTVAGFVPTEFPRPAPDALLTGPDGEEAVLSQLTDDASVTVVNLWATWCAPCLTELPALAELEDRVDGVRVVPVAMQRPDEAARTLLAEAGFDDPDALADPSLGLMRTFGPDLALPLTVLYDERGIEVGRIEGAAEWTAPEAIRLIEAVRDGAASF